MPRLIVLALALALMLLAPAARAEALRALLIGVGAYPNLTGADLRGPVNDVRLMAEVLIGRGVAPSDITVLTTDPAGLPAGVATGLPTRAAILGGLDALARAAGPGQTVVVHYSGHGSQAPDDNGDEMGGMDEILLPMDVAGWRGSAGGVANAIVDDEMQGRMQAILDTGARLVGIIDACHSATGFRALGAPGVARTLDPAALGVPANAGPAPAGTANPPLAGEFVFLYAAQSDQRAFEYPLEQGTDPPAWYGAFTRQLAGVLRAAPQATWAQVLAEVSGTMRQGSAVQTPDGEGPLLAAPIPGAVAGGRRLALADGRVQAGLLWGLTEGSVVDVYPAATAAAPVARARLVRLRADTAELEAAPGTSLPAAGAVEVVAPAPPPPLRLMRPAAGGDWDGLLAAAVAAGLAEWSVASADLVPVVTPEGALALAGADGVLDPAGPGSSPRIAPGAGAAGRLNALLADAGHALRLRRALAGAGGRGAPPGGGGGAAPRGRAPPPTPPTASRIATSCG